MITTAEILAKVREAERATEEHKQKRKSKMGKKALNQKDKTLESKKDQLEMEEEEIIDCIVVM